MHYREAPRELPPRAEDVRWRVQVARSVRAVFWCLIAASVFSGNTLAHFVVSAALTWFAWQLSAPRPVSDTRNRRQLRAWLRGLSLASLVATALSYLGFLTAATAAVIAGRPTIHYAPSIVGAFAIALDVIGFLYVRELFREFADDVGEARSRKLLRTYAWATGAGTASVTALFVVGQTDQTAIVLVFGSVANTLLTTGLLISGVVLFVLGINTLNLLSRLRSKLRVVEHAWWFKEGAGWASLGVDAGGSAEVTETNGERRMYPHKDDAEEALRHDLYLTRHDAIATAATLAAPPPVDLTPEPVRERFKRVLMAPFQRERLRHDRQVQRVRVEEEPSIGPDPAEALSIDDLAPEDDEVAENTPKLKARRDPQT